MMEGEVSGKQVAGKTELTVRVTLEEARAAAKEWATPENLAALDALSDRDVGAQIVHDGNNGWSNFDQRRNAKGGEAANEAGGDSESEVDMFKAAGIAAE